MASQHTLFDYHIHTCYSHDCRTPVNTVVDTAIRRGLKEIAVTDHDTIAGGLAALAYARGKPIKIIVGAEINTDRGEVIGLGLKEEIQERKLEDVIRAIKAQGGQVMIPHPFGFLRRRKLKVPLEDLLGQIDFIEVYNGRNIVSGCRQAMEFAVSHGIRTTVGSDAHFAFEIGNTGHRVNWRGWLGYFATGILKRF